MRVFRDAEDICAVIIVLGCIVLLVIGIDGEIKGILGVAAGWIFGKGFMEIKNKGGKNG